MRNEPRQSVFFVLSAMKAMSIFCNSQRGEQASLTPFLISDGVLRRTPLVMRFGNNLYPSLALEMMRLYFFEDKFEIQTEGDLTGQFNKLTGIKVGQVFIPTDSIWPGINTLRRHLQFR